MIGNVIKKYGVFLVLFFFVLHVPITRADRVKELEGQIQDKSSQIEELQQDITKYQIQLNEIGEEKKTLQSEIQTLSITRQKIEKDISLTEKKIDTTVLSIEELTAEIDRKEKSIQLNTGTIGETIRKIHSAESQSLVETVLGYDTISDAVSDIDQLGRFQLSLNKEIAELTSLKGELEARKEELLKEQSALGALKGDLAGRHSAVKANENEKESLLTVTKNEEANYQALLNEKLRQREKFEQELQEIESELRLIVDPDSIPSQGKGILNWPLDDVYITQYFGNTPFATANPQVYKGNGHTGIDLRAARGTKVKSALSGVVVGADNTDSVRGCYSFGKWVMVKHNNGLSTLYAHLDVISVSQGQSVKTGDTIGFSGNTGFSTAPHLHFGVYASQGVKIQPFTSSINCKNAIVPTATRDAYLNPLSYL